AFHIPATLPLSAAETDDSDVVGGTDVIVKRGEDSGASAHQWRGGGERQCCGDVEGIAGVNGEVRGKAAHVGVGLAVEGAVGTEDFGARDALLAGSTGLEMRVSVLDTKISL